MGKRVLKPPLPIERVLERETQVEVENFTSNN